MGSLSKVGGTSQIHIMVCVGFKYEKVDKVISFIQNQKYEAKWGTANINIDALMDTKVSYGFNVNENTEIEPIVQNILNTIVKYAFSFLKSCDTLEKYEEMLLGRDKCVRKSTVPLKKPEWNLVALAIILDHKNIDDIFEEYKKDFQKDLVLLKIARERIMKYDVMTEVDV